MKRGIFLLLAFLLPISFFAQAPQAFNYQGVARDLAGNPTTNKSIGLRIAILQNSISGTEIYKETHETTTNKLGLFKLRIGDGVVVSGVFENIEWGMSDHFLQIELDEENDGDFQLVGTSQLLSVPYALHAGNGSKWNDSNYSVGLHYGHSVIVGGDKQTTSPFIVNNTRPTIGKSTNTILSQFVREYQGEKIAFNIYGYPNTDLVHSHLRNSIMLYATQSAKDLVLCANQDQGRIRFFAGNWEYPNSERAIITPQGLGIGISEPKSKLHVKNGDIFVEDFSNGIIMKSPDGKCWVTRVGNDGQLSTAPTTCPD